MSEQYISYEVNMKPDLNMKVQFDSGMVLEIITEENQKRLCLVKDERFELLNIPIEDFKYLHQMVDQFKEYLDKQ